MSDVFISYSRKDISFAQRLHKSLEENNLDTWIDWQDIPPSEDWLDEIHESIEQTDAFIFIISKRSVDSEVCSQELIHAFENQKRLIPIVIDDIAPSDVPPSVATLNWIFFRESDDYDAAVSLLLEAIQTDQAWVKAHTRYQMRALEWERNQHANAYLLQGIELDEAESWLLTQGHKDITATERQTEYILTSRQAITQRQRLLFGGVGVGLVVALVLSIFAILQRGVAIEQRDQQATAEALAVAEAYSRATAEAVAVGERDARATAQAESQVQRDVAVSQYLAAQSSALSKYYLSTKMLLGIEASRFYNGIEARSALLEALLAEPHLGAFILQDQDFQTQSMALSEDGMVLALGNPDGEILLLDTDSGDVLARMVHEEAEAIDRLVFSGDRSTLISVNASQEVLAWDLASEPPLPKTISAYNGRERFLAVNHNGQEIAVLNETGDVVVMSTQTGEILQRIQGSGSEDTPMIFSPDGTLLAAFHAYSEVRIWDRESGRMTYQYSELPENASESVYRSPLNTQFTLAFNPRSDALIFATGHETYYWEIMTDEITATNPSYLAGYNELGEPMAFSHSRFEPFQWNILEDRVTAGPLAYSLGGDPYAGELLGYAWSPLTEQVLLIWEDVGNDTLVIRYDFNEPIPIRKQIPDSLNIKTVAHDPAPGSNLMIVAGCAHPGESASCSRGLIQFRDSRSGEILGDPIEAHDDWITGVAISPDGETFATVSSDGSIQLWDLASRSPKGDALRFKDVAAVDRLRFHPEGSTLAFRAGSGSEKGIAFIDLQTQELLGEPLFITDDGVNNSVYNFAFSPDGTLLAVSQHNIGLIFWDIREISSPSLPQDIELPFVPSALVFDSTGQKLAAGMSGMAAIADIVSGEVILPPGVDQITGNITRSVAFSPDGLWIITLLDDDTVQLIDSTSGLPIGSPLAGFDKTNTYSDALVISSDSARFITVNARRNILIYDLDLKHWQEIGCSMINSNLDQEQWTTYLEDMEYRETCLISQ